MNLMIIHLFKASILYQVAVIQFILIAKLSWCKYSYNSVPQAVATTIAFPSVFTLILYTMLRSQKSQRWTDDRADLPSITKGRRPPRKTSGLSKTRERPKDRHCFRPACVNRCSGKEPPAELQTCSLSGRVGVAVLVMPAVFCRVCLAVEAVSTGCWAS